MQVQPVPPSVSTKLKTLALGDHLCLFYDQPAEQLAITAEYLALGLQRGERCLYVSDVAMIVALRATLAEAGLDVKQERARGALVLLTTDEAHLTGGRFDAEGMLAMLGRAVDSALAAGFTGLRAAGDMSWLLDDKPGSDQVLEYEALLNEFYPRFPALGLCLYDRRRLHPLALEGALRAHPTTFIGDRCCEHNPFYEPPDVFFERIDQRERFEWKLGRLQGVRSASPATAQA